MPYGWGGSALADPNNGSSFFPATTASQSASHSFPTFPSAAASNAASGGSMDFNGQKRLRYSDSAAAASFTNSYTAAAAAAAAAVNNPYAQFAYNDGQQSQPANIAAQLPVNMSQFPSVLSATAAANAQAQVGAVNSLQFQLRPPSGQSAGHMPDSNFFSSALSSLYGQKAEQDAARAFAAAAAASGQRPPSATNISPSMMYPGLSTASLHSAAASMLPTAGLSMSMLPAGMDPSQLSGLFNGSQQLGSAGMMAGLSSLPSLPTTASSLSSNMFRHPSPLLNQLLPNQQLSAAGLLNSSLLQPQPPLMHSQSHPGTQADMFHLTGHMSNSAAQSATSSAYCSPALSAASGSSHPVSPLPLAPSSSVMETVTLSTLTCLIEKQYTIRKTESDRMPEVDKKQLIPVHVRILKEKHRATGDSTSPALRGMVGVKRERDDDLMLTPPKAGQPINGTNVTRSASYTESYMSPAASPTLVPTQADEHSSPSGFDSNSSAASSNSSFGSSSRPPSPRLYIPATDIGPLLNIRKNNIPGYISKYDSSLRQQMMVDCPRAAGGVARVQLNVLTIAGAEKFIMTSRSKQAEKVWAWIHQHVSKIYKEQQTLLMQQHAAQQQQQQQQQQAVREQQQPQQSHQQTLQATPDSQLPPPHPFAMVDRMSMAQQEAHNAATSVSGAVVPVTTAALLKATNGVKLDPNGSPLSTASSNMSTASPATYSLSASDISSISSPSSAALSTSTGSSPASSSSASSTSASRCSSPSHSLAHMPPSPSFRFAGMQTQYS